jgi:Tyosinase C-terminal domain
MQSRYLAAINYIFAAPREFCDNCGYQDDVGQLASDTHPITPLLLDYLSRTDNHLESLEPEHVRPFLVNNLRWRVVYVCVVLLLLSRTFVLTAL